MILVIILGYLNYCEELDFAIPANHIVKFKKK